MIPDTRWLLASSNKMNYKAKIYIMTKDKEKLITLFNTEDKEFQKRSNYLIVKEKDGVSFDVSASDAVALRAALNSITKTLIIFEKTDSV